MNKGTYSLSGIQESILLDALYSADPTIDVTQVVCKIDHELDKGALGAACDLLVSRHEILRVSFDCERPTGFRQIVHPSAEIPLRLVDLRSGSDFSDKSLSRFISDDRARTFDLSAPPLIRLSLLLLPSARWWLVLTFHNLILDIRSLHLLLKELFDYYDAYHNGDTITLPPGLPYRDYVSWINKHDWKESTEFWISYLKDVVSPTPLMVGNQLMSPLPPTVCHKECSLEVSKQLTTQVNDFAKEHQLTIMALLLGAWGILLSRYSSVRPVLFGAHRECSQPFKGSEPLIGPVMNILPVVVDPINEIHLCEFLADLQHQWRTMQAHEHTPFSIIKSCSQIAGGAPLFETLVHYERHDINAALRSFGEQWKHREFHLLHKPSVPLSLYAVGETELLLKIIFNPKLFEESVVNRMLGHTHALLEEFTSKAHAELINISMLTPSERHYLVKTFNATKVNYARDRTLVELFEKRAEASPDIPAVRHLDEVLSYRELNELADRTASRLLSLRVSPEEPIGLCVDRSVGMIVGILGILKAGGAYLPLDPSYPTNRLSLMSRNALVRLILSQGESANKFPDFFGEVVRIDKEALNSYVKDQQRPKVHSDNIAYILYTSGSTGIPKGIACCHQTVVNLLNDFQTRQPLANGDRGSLWTSINFDVSVYEIFSTLLYGAELDIVPDEVRYDPHRFFEWLSEQGVTSAYIPPFMLEELSRWLDNPNATLRLKRLLVGVEPIEEEILVNIASRIPGLHTINGYGPTEATVCATLYSVPSSKSGSQRTPIGMPVQNTQIYLLDQRMRLCPLCVPGEIYIGGDGLARGYFNRPDLTAEKFIPDPFSNIPGQRLYITGDLARRLENGSIEFISRVDNQIKIRGFRIEPAEIETVLVAHPNITEAVVQTYEDDTRGMHLAAYVILNDEQPSHSDEELRTYLLQHLPEYMVPTLFAYLREFPRTSNDKIDRKGLANIGISQFRVDRSYKSPRNSTEQIIAEIWRQLLGLDRVGIDDNFFIIGGHSLLAIQVVNRLNSIFQVDFKPSILFKSSTIRDLSKVVMRFVVESIEKLSEAEVEDMLRDV